MRTWKSTAIEVIVLLLLCFFNFVYDAVHRRLQGVNEQVSYLITGQQHMKGHFVSYVFYA